MCLGHDIVDNFITLQEEDFVNRISSERTVYGKGMADNCRNVSDRLYVKRAHYVDARPVRHRSQWVGGNAFVNSSFLTDKNYQTIIATQTVIWFLY